MIQVHAYVLVWIFLRLAKTDFTIFVRVTVFTTYTLHILYQTKCVVYSSARNVLTSHCLQGITTDVNNSGLDDRTSIGKRMSPL